MLCFAADENFSGKILRGLRRVLPTFDVLRVQDYLPEGTPDPAELSWAAGEGRILLTHDVSTMTVFAWDRVRRGEPMPGVIEITETLPIGDAIKELQIIAAAGLPVDFADRVVFVKPESGSM